MSFKDQLAADVKNVFLNTGEFAEAHNVRYDGMLYENIPVVLTKVKQSERTITAGDHLKGVHMVSAKAYISSADMDGVIPEQGTRIEIDDGQALGKPFYRRYSVVTSEDAMGMITLELEAHDE